MPLHVHFSPNYSIEILKVNNNLGARHYAQRQPPTVVATGKAMLLEVNGPRRPSYRKLSGVDVTDEVLAGLVMPDSIEILSNLVHGTQCRLVPLDQDLGLRPFYAVFVIRTFGDPDLFKRVSGNDRPITFAVMKQSVQT